MNWSERVKAERTRRGMSQRAFAKLMDVSALIVNRWESGKTCKPHKKSIDALEKLEETTRLAGKYESNETPLGEQIDGGTEEADAMMESEA